MEIMETVFRSTKLLDGFSACFRQHKAKGTHCRFLHGYAISFLVVFEGDLDHRNWVVDFGGFKRSRVLIDGLNPKAWFDYNFDHTTIVAEDDPEFNQFQLLNELEVIQLRTLPTVGCEMFAKYVFEKLQIWVQEETRGRVNVVSVECKEHERNSAIYKRQRR